MALAHAMQRGDLGAGGRVRRAQCFYRRGDAMLHKDKSGESRASAPSRPVEKIVTAFFDRTAAANRAYAEIQAAGVDSQNITVAANQTLARRDLAMTEHTKAPEGGVTGAAVGAGVGALAGAFALAGSLLLPGIGWIAGPLVGALAGAGAGGVAGGLVGALVGAGMPEHEARVVEDTVRQGGVVIAVHVVPAQVGRVREIMKANGGRALSMS
jgi:hypothetical protein